MDGFSLDALGWNDWFAAQAGRCREQDEVARVAAVDRVQLLLVGRPGFFRARLSGKYLHEAEAGLPRPCVGDWVCVEKAPQDAFGIVQAILERRSSLRRKAPGEGIEAQMIAANVDVVIVAQSCHFDFNLKRLERYLVMIREGGALPLLLLTKTDLVAPDVLAAQIDEIRRAGISAPVVTLSNVTQQGIDELKRLLVPGQTYCLVGSSGVGKSTLINALAGHAVQDTSEISASGEGRHTTVRRELLLLDNGAMVIDNPGMREFGVLAGNEGMGASHADIAALAAHCRFRDCAHRTEPGCAVLEALARGEIDAGHYDNFVKLRSESEFHQLSHAEKRKKDRDFGKFIKSAKKDLDQD